MIIWPDFIEDVSLQFTGHMLRLGRPLVHTMSKITTSNNLGWESWKNLPLFTESVSLLGGQDRSYTLESDLSTSEVPMFQEISSTASRKC